MRLGKDIIIIKSGFLFIFGKDNGHFIKPVLVFVR